MEVKAFAAVVGRCRCLDAAVFFLLLLLLLLLVLHVMYFSAVSGLTREAVRIPVKLPAIAGDKGYKSWANSQCSTGKYRPPLSARIPSD